jgi:serine/threonine-protein kinase RsbW
MRRETLASRLKIDSRASELPRIGEALRPLCATLHLTHEECGRVELAVVEAVTNVIRHAYENRPGHPVDIRFESSPRRLVVEVRDCGRPMAAEALQAAQLPEADGADLATLCEGGFGLAIMKTVMDEVEYRSGGRSNVLRMTKRWPGGT